ncbi:MAG: polyphosphate polymerase domain-containing protein [Bacteroidales bacterium]
MNNLSAILSSFSPISLEEMDRVKLLDRIDTKFVVHEDQLPEFLTAVDSKYSLLIIAGESVHPYETLYFDTPDYNLYRMHHNGRRNRFKLRCRKYVNSGIAYFEIKSKTNTRRTIKKRMRIDNIPETLSEQLNQYISLHTPGNYRDFVPALRVFFDRLTFVNKQANERLTIDLNLRYENNGVEKKIEKIAIVEVKQEKHSISPFRQLMKQQRLQNNYLSKYCLGLICLIKGIKMNRFQQKINALTKLGYDIY